MHKNPDWKCCDKYDEKNTKEIIMHGGKQYSKIVCANCGHYIRFGRNPEIQMKYEQRNQQINEILVKYKEELSDKIVDFLSNIKQKKYPTISQIKYLGDIFEKYKL